MPSRDPLEEVSSHVQEALQLLEAKESRKLSTFLHDLHPVELVGVINAVEPEMQAPLLKHITGLDHLSAVVALANEHLRRTALEMIDDSRIAAVIRRQEIDDAAHIMGDLSRRRQVRVLRRLGAQRVKELTSLLAYDQDTAGRIMTTRFLSFPPEQTTDDVIDELRDLLRSSEIDKDTDLSYAYLLDAGDIPIGVCSLRELLSAESGSSIVDISTRELLVVSPEEDQEKVAKLIADYDLSAIPVCADENGKMLGIITVDDVLDIIEEEHTEDILKMVGTEDQDTVGATVLVAVRSRLPWLLASWLGGILGAMLLGSYESTIEQMVALAFFMPVVFGMGGNVGSQSSTITVHGLATGELVDQRATRRLRKETAVGGLLGIAFGLLLLAASYFLFHSIHLSIVLGCSILATMTCASALGAMLPMMFKRLGFDPAVASGPLVTTTTDILSISIYFSIATLLL